MVHLRTPLLIIFLLITSTQAAQFVITNNCPYTVWAAAVPGGGIELSSGASWTISADPGTTSARIWARTGCTSTGANGLKCNTGDCGGLLQCTGYGSPPNTLAEYSLRQYMNLDFFDISLVQGFNVPMDFSPTSGGCTKGITCNADIMGQCPAALRVTGGCDDPCTKLNQDQYCCPNGSACNPTDYSRFFKGLCPDAYSYPKDDATSTFTCPSGTDYKVVFCP